MSLSEPTNPVQRASMAAGLKGHAKKATPDLGSDCA